MKSPIYQPANTLVSTSKCPLEILGLPKQLADSLWVKANELAEDSLAIVTATGPKMKFPTRSFLLDSYMTGHTIEFFKCMTTKI